MNTRDIAHNAYIILKFKKLKSYNKISYDHSLNYIKFKSIGTICKIIISEIIQIKEIEELLSRMWTLEALLYKNIYF